MQYAIAAIVGICITLFMIASKQSKQLDDLSDKYFEATERLQMTKTCLEAMEKDREKWKQMYTESERVRKKLCEEVKTNEKT